MVVRNVRELLNHYLLAYIFLNIIWIYQIIPPSKPTVHNQAKQNHPAAAAANSLRSLKLRAGLNSNLVPPAWTCLIITSSTDCRGQFIFTKLVGVGGLRVEHPCFCFHKVLFYGRRSLQMIVSEITYIPCEGRGSTSIRMGSAAEGFWKAIQFGKWTFIVSSIMKCTLCCLIFIAFIGLSNCI